MPQRVDFRKVALFNQDNEVTVESGDHRQTFPGQVDQQGRVQISNHFGTLTQTLDGHVRLEQTVLSGRLQITHNGDQISTTYHSNDRGYQEASAKEIERGTYRVLYEGGEIDIQAPVPAALLGPRE